jgi:glycosyltransferase involved in cell wall biosynthesis
VNSSQSEPAALTLFEFLVGGHAPNFMRLVLDAWVKHAAGRLEIVVTREFVDRHGCVFQGAAPGGLVRWSMLDAEDELIVTSLRAKVVELRKDSDRLHGVQDDGRRNPLWQIITRYSERLPSRHVFIMNLDEHLYALANGGNAPRTFSGIFFLPGYLYRASNSSLRRRVIDILQERLMPQLLQHPQLRIAFFLDPWAVQILKGAGFTKVSYLPDPVRLPARDLGVRAREEAKTRIGAPKDRKLFLFFGDIRGRKGIWRLMDALEHLTGAERAETCIAIVGHAESSVEMRLMRLLKSLADTPLSIIRRAAYVDEGELGDWFTAADVILAPYSHHVGMSSMLLLAAAYRRPAISQNFGPMAKLTEESRLGLTVDSCDPEALADAMRRFLDGESPPEWDPEKAHALAERQSEENFGKTLLDALRPFIS